MRILVGGPGKDRAVVQLPRDDGLLLFSIEDVVELREPPEPGYPAPHRVEMVGWVESRRVLLGKKDAYVNNELAVEKGMDTFLCLGIRL